MSYTAVGVTNNWGGVGNTTSASANVLSTIIQAANYSGSNTITFTLGGLTLGTSYDLYAIMNTNQAGRATDFSVNGQVQTVSCQANFTTIPITSPLVYTEFTNLVPTGTGVITISASINPYSSVYYPAGTGPGLLGAEFDVNGLQLVPLTSAVYGIPNTNIAAAASTTLNLGVTGQPFFAGSLTLRASSSPTLTLGGASIVSFSNPGSAISASSASGGAAAINGSTGIAIGTGSVNVDPAASLAIGVPIVDGTTHRADQGRQRLLEPDGHQHL